MTAKIVHIISNQPHESNMLLQEKRKKIMNQWVMSQWAIIKQI